MARYSSACTFYAYGVLSLPRTWAAQWWGIGPRGAAQWISGYAVESIRVVDILRRRARRRGGWRENTPHLFAPDRYLVFHEEACRIVDI